MKKSILIALFAVVSFTAFSQNDSKSKTTDIVYVSLLNESDQSIPLIIPTVMNPNLLPNSKSGVNMRIGQKVYFRYKGKKQLLLTVTKDLDNSSLEVSALLKKRKAEINHRNNN